MIPAKKYNIIQLTLLSLLINLAYAIGNLLIGSSTSSWWFITLGIYYIILSFTRLAVIAVRKKEGIRISKFVGIMLIITALPLLAIALISAARDVGTSFHEIIMIAIALYSFSKITLAIINMVRARKHNSWVEKALRNISLADGFVSIASLQRSMLVSFEGMTDNEIRLFNILTGTGVCIIVFLLGINLLFETRYKAVRKQQNSF